MVGSATHECSARPCRLAPAVGKRPVPGKAPSRTSGRRGLAGWWACLARRSMGMPRGLVACLAVVGHASHGRWARAGGGGQASPESGSAWHGYAQLAPGWWALRRLNSGHGLSGGRHGVAGGRHGVAGGRHGVAGGGARCRGVGGTASLEFWARFAPVVGTVSRVVGSATLVWVSDGGGVSPGTRRLSGRS